MSPSSPRASHETTDPTSLQTAPAIVTLLLLFLLLLSIGCVSAPPSAPEDGPETTAPQVDATAEEPGEPNPAEEPAEDQSPSDPCAGGVIKDDGATDLGYSFVPSSVEAIYLQAFHSDELPSREIGSVCVCFFQKPGGSDADFEVVFHADGGGGPALEPFAAVPAVATALGQGRDDAKLYEVDISGVTVPEGPFYVGARWNPSEEVRLYICADHSPESEKAEGFYKDDRQQGWRSVFRTADPTFNNHRSLLVRVKSTESE